MQKINDYRLLQIAYDYQYNKNDFINAAQFLRRLISEFPKSEYIKDARQRLEEMGMSVTNLESMHEKHLNHIKENIPSNLREIFLKYEGNMIVINYKDHANYRYARLIKISDDYFTIVTDDSYIYHFPYRYVISLAEGKNELNEEYVIVEVFHLIASSDKGVTGGIGMGIGVLFDLG